MAKGESAHIRGYTLTFNTLSSYPTENRHIVSAILSVAKDGKDLGVLRPEKRFYRKSEQPITEVAIRSTLKEDLYVILSGYEEESASFKFIVNPLTVWLWIGGAVMALGGIVVMWPDKREKRRFAARYVVEESGYGV